MVGRANERGGHGDRRLQGHHRPFNFTKAAENSNAENLLIIEDASLAKQYAGNWEKHLKHSEAYGGK